MKKRTFQQKDIRCMVMLLILTGLICLCGIPGAKAERVRSYGSFTGSETVNAKCSNLDEHSDFMNSWLYVPTTIPDGYRTTLVTYPYLYPISGSYKSVVPTSYSAEFISGNEHFRNAILFDDYSSGSPQLMMLVDNDCLTEPGQAVFRIRMAGENLYYETDYTLTVLSWTEAPLFELKDEPAIAQGGSESAPFYDTERITAMFLKDHYNEIASVYPEVVSGRYGAPYYAYTKETYDESKVKRGYGFYGDTWQFLDYGSYQYSLQCSFGNVICYLNDLTVNVLPYTIHTKGLSRPGGNVQFSIRDAQPESGRSFSWALEGEGLTLDQETLVLTIPETAAEGTAFTVTATPSDGGTAITYNGTVSSGALTAPVFTAQSSGVGFMVPTLVNEGYRTTVAGYNLVSYTSDEEASSLIMLVYNTCRIKRFTEDPEAARQYYDEQVASLQEQGRTITEQKEVMIGGHPARLLLGDLVEPAQAVAIKHTGIIIYVRNNQRLLGYVDTGKINEETAEEDIPPVLMSDLETIAANITYNASQAPYTLDDCSLTITAKDNAETLTAGKKLQMTATFSNPDKVNKKAKNDGVTWTAVSAETGETVDGITIDAKGNLSAAKAIAEVYRVRVTAQSEEFGTTADLEITVIPAATGIELEPAELLFYLGEDRTETVTVSLTPETVPLIGITWKPNKEGIVEILPEAGTAKIRGLAIGKVTVTVQEPGGKKKNLQISVVEPVTAVELTTKGKATPGGSVTISASLTPKKPGNSTLEWSLDVGEDIATIKNGRVKISKTAPVGTTITVTCRALGAPVPVETTIQIEIIEK